MKQKLSNIARMGIWLAFGLAFYIASYLVGPANPQLQTIFYKLGHVTTLAWAGYWISRHAIGRLDFTSSDGERTARAIIIGCVILAGSMGL